MKSWEDDDTMRFRPLTTWDKVAFIILVFGFGTVVGAAMTMWIGQHVAGGTP